MVRLCNYVMVLLRGDFTKERKQEMEVKAVTNMAGKTYQDKLRLVLETLRGLKTYIVLAERDDVAAWDFNKRNQISHGGAFLKCFCPQSIVADKDALTEYIREVERWANFEENVKEETKLRGYYEGSENIEQAVLDILKVLTKKGVAVVSEKNAKKLAKKVTDTVGSPEASPEPLSSYSE